MLLPGLVQPCQLHFQKGRGHAALLGKGHSLFRSGDGHIQDPNGSLGLGHSRRGKSGGGFQRQQLGADLNNLGANTQNLIFDGFQAFRHGLHFPQQRGGGCRDLLIGGSFGSGKLLLALLDLLFRGNELQLRLGQLVFAVNEQLFIVNKLLLTVFQLLQGIIQFLVRLRLAFGVFHQSLGIFLHAVPVGFHGLLPHFLQTAVCHFLQGRLQGIGGRLQGIGVFVGIDGMLTGDGDVDLRIVVHVQGFRRDIEIAGQAAAAHGGGAAVHVHIQGRGNIAHHFKGAPGHAIQGILRVGLGNGHFFAQKGVAVQEAVSQTFLRAFGHPSAPQGDLVDSLRDLQETEHRVHLCALQPGDQVYVADTFRVHHALQLGCFLYIFLCPAIAVHQPQVEHVLPVHKHLSRGDHIRLGHQKPQKQCRTQRDNGRQGNIASQRF